MKTPAGSTLVGLVAAASAATVLPRSTSQSLCATTSYEEGGNWYCQAVKQITYANVGTASSYDEVVSMDQATGNCVKRKKAFAGGLAPFNEPLSIHIRGPFQLKKVAVYMPKTTNASKRDEEEAIVKRQHHGHGHAHLHKKAAAAKLAKKATESKKLERKAIEERQHPTVWVTATIDGKVQSWINNYWGPEPTAAPVWVTATINGQVVSWTNNYWPDRSSTKAAVIPAPTAAPIVSVPAVQPTAQPTLILPPSPGVPAPGAPAAGAPAVGVPAPGAPAQGASPSAGGQGTSPVTPPKSDPAPGPSYGDGVAAGDYVRTAFYDSAAQHAQGLTFLANYGGQGSGKWTPKFGNTLSYVDSTGSRGAASAQVLSDVTIGSAKEITIMSDEVCDGSCGYIQPGSVAYKGFGGSDKVFLFEFAMPHEGSTQGFLADQPALWFLNARIPYTMQYGDCSCWNSGCGEFDVFEVLANGDNKCKSTFHSVFAGGDSNYFQRPAGAPVRAAVVFNAKNQAVSVKVLDDTSGVDFSAGLTSAQVTALLADSATAKAGKSGAMSSALTSLFSIA